MSEGTRGFVSRKSLIGVALALTLIAGALFGTACGGSTPATTATTPADEAVVVESGSGDSPTTTESVEVVTSETTATAEAPDFVLGKDDSTKEFRLKVGKRVRIELKPYVNDRIKAVEWEYSPIVVQKVDSGTTVIEDVVVECWLELEGVVPGPVTVRAYYEYPHGNARATWVAYLFVEE